MKEFDIKIKEPIQLEGKIQLKRGIITFLEGKTGSGKTTVVYHMLASLQNKHHFAYMSQKYNILDTMTIYENFSLLSLSRKQVEELLPLINIDASIDTKISELSGGQKQRIALALILYSNQDYIFLDEPTSGLDEYNAIIIMDFIKHYVQQYHPYILIINHNSGLHHYAKRIYRIEKNSIDCLIVDDQEEQLLIDQKKNIHPFRFMLLYLKKNKLFYGINILLTFCILILSSVGTIAKNRFIDQLSNQVSTYAIIQSENIEELRCYFQEIIPYPSIFTDYNGTPAIIYPAVGKMDFVEYDSNRGVYIKEEDATLYSIHINDVILTESEIYYVTGILSNSYIDPIPNNQKLIFYKENMEKISTDTYLGIFNSLVQYEKVLDEVNSLNDKTYVTLSSSYTKAIIESNVFLYQMISKGSLFAFTIILLLMLMINNKFILAHRSDIYYLMCLGISKTYCLMISISIHLIIFFLYLIISIWYQGISILFILDLVLQTLLYGYYIYSKKELYKSLRSNES